MMDRVEVYQSRRGLRRRTQWRWRFVAANGRTLADSGEGYANLPELLSSLAKVINVAADSLMSMALVSTHTRSLHIPERRLQVVLAS